MRKTGIILLASICFWSLPLLSYHRVPEDPIAEAYEKVTRNVLQMLEADARDIRRIRDDDLKDPATPRAREIKTKLWINFFNKLDSFYDSKINLDEKSLPVLTPRSVHLDDNGFPETKTLSDPKARADYEKYLEALRKEREDLARKRFQRDLISLDRFWTGEVIWYFETYYKPNAEDANTLVANLRDLKSGKREDEFRGRLPKFLQFVQGKADDNAKRTIVDDATGQYVVIGIDGGELISKSQDGKTIWIADVRRAEGLLQSGGLEAIYRRSITFVKVSNGELNVLVGKDEFRVDKPTGALTYLGAY